MGFTKNRVVFFLICNTSYYLLLFYIDNLLVYSFSQQPTYLLLATILIFFQFCLVGSMVLLQFDSLLGLLLTLVLVGAFAIVIVVLFFLIVRAFIIIHLLFLFVLITQCLVLLDIRLLTGGGLG